MHTLDHPAFHPDDLALQEANELGFKVKNRKKSRRTRKPNGSDFAPIDNNWKRQNKCRNQWAKRNG